MANVLTDLASDIQIAADTVAREMVGATTSVLLNTNGVERAALNDSVRSFVTRESSAVDVSPAMTIPEGTDQTVDSKTLTITKAKAVQIPWTGEDIKHVNNGAGFQTIYGDQIKQAMRTLTNLIEVDVLTEASNNASRAIGTAGTTPFASDFKPVAQLRQILADNGAPLTDGQLTLILDSAAGVQLRNLAQLQKVNESGSSELVRQGVLLDLQGFGLKESAGIVSHTKGTGAGFLMSGAGAIGDTALSVDTGTGTILAGDVITFAADTVNKYVVVGALSGGVVTIASPGLRVAIADNNAITVGANYTGNVGFHRNAIELAMRAPAVPNGGDAADDAITAQDANSNLVFEIRSYKGYRKAMFEVAACWGVKAWKPDFIATLLG